MVFSLNNSLTKLDFWCIITRERNTMASSVTHKTKIQAALRRRDALALRIAGHTYRAIVDILRKREADNKLEYEVPESYDARNCYRDVKHDLDAVLNERRENASELISLELNRLDDMTASIYSMLEESDGEDGVEPKIKLAAIDRLLKISERRSKLMGLDRPQKLQVIDWRSEIIALITSGQLTMEDVRKELPQVADEISTQLAESRSAGTIEVRALEAPSEQV